MAKTKAMTHAITQAYIDPTKQLFRVGKDGVTQIRETDRAGEMARVPWIEIDFDDGTLVEVAARYCVVTHELVEADENGLPF